jgi:hypothetical protein
MKSRAAFLGPGSLAALAAVLALSAAGCATPLKIGASVDPLAILEPGSLAYARLDGTVARAFLPAVMPPDSAKSLTSVLARTRLVAIGIGALSSIKSGDPPAGPAFQACLIGDYPFRSAALSLDADPAWKREKVGYFNPKIGLRVAIPGPNLVVASTERLEPLIAASGAPGTSPIPTRLSALSSRRLTIWVPEPFSRLAAALFGDPMDVPVVGLLVAADPVSGSDDDYDATVAFLMKDAESALIFRPALRLAWFGIARGLLGIEGDGALGVPFTQDGDLFQASGIRLSGRTLARALRALRSGFAASGGPARGEGI